MDREIDNPGRPIVRNIGFMGASTAVRLLVGVLTFGLMARLLGAQGFGTVMTALAGSVLAGLVVNFGLATYVLREMGAATTVAARRLMGEVLSAKLVLVLAVTVAALFVLPWLPPRWRGLAALMLLAQMFDGVTDLLNVGFRATGRYAAETRIATVASLLQLGCVGGALLLWPVPLAAAAAYCSARGAVLWMTWRGQRAYFGGLRPAPWRRGAARLAHARSYAADFGLQSLFGQIDSIVIAHYFGTAAVGLYQAGMRLFQGGAQAASVLGNVAIPKLSAMHLRGERIDSEAQRAQIAFLAVGAIGGLTLASLPQQGILTLLGKDYAPLSRLLPWFGLLFVVRFSASSTGVLLTVIGKQSTRARLTLLHWLVVSAVTLAALPQFGVQGWLFALVVGNTVLSAGYAFILIRSRQVQLGVYPFALMAASAIFLIVQICRWS